MSCLSTPAGFRRSHAAWRIRKNVFFRSRGRSPGVGDTQSATFKRVIYMSAPSGASPSDRWNAVDSGGSFTN